MAHGTVSIFASGIALAVVVLCSGGCSTLGQNLALAAGSTGALGITPGANIQQTYYLGIYDPREQLAAPQFYRVRVRGQASALSTTRVASGWVRSELIDSLGSSVQFNNETGKIETDAGSGAGLKLAAGRRMILFGPEGFREAPVDHRLVVVMGSSPEKFFSMVDQTLGIVAAATQQKPDSGYERERIENAQMIRSQRESLDRLLADIGESADGGYENERIENSQTIRSQRESLNRLPADTKGDT